MEAPRGADRGGGAVLPAVRTVLVVDDHRAVAELLRLALNADPELTCVGTAHDAAAAIRLATALRPDVVVCDLNLAPGGPSGLEVAHTLTTLERGCVVLLLTGDAGEMRLEELRDSGASGLLAKDGDLEALLSAVRHRSRDQLEIDPRLLRHLTRPPSPPATVSLSRREQEVLLLMADGRDVGTISRRLGIRPGTCRGYIKSLLHKVGAHSQLEAVARARTLGLLGRQP